MSKVYKEKTKKKRIRISAEYMEGKLHFKTGEGKRVWMPDHIFYN